MCVQQFWLFAFPFSSTPPPPAITPLQAADLNGDGAPDIIVGNSLQVNKVYLNLGNGLFSSTSFTSFGSDTEDTYSVVVDQMNTDDSIPDLIVGNSGQANKVYISPSSTPGDFSQVSGGSIGENSLEYGNTRSILVGLLDSDSFKDIVVIDANLPSRTYLNPGSGDFSATSVVYVGVGLPPARALVLGDIDSNGLLDVIAGNQLYLNPSTSSGDFSNVVPTRIGTPDARCAALGDLDGDVR